MKNQISKKDNFSALVRINSRVELSQNRYIRAYAKNNSGKGVVMSEGQALRSILEKFIKKNPL